VKWPEAGSESCPLSPLRVFRSGSRRIRDGAPLYFDALRRRRHGACASRMTQTPPPATIRKPKPKPKRTHCWAGAVARKKRARPRYRRSSITGDAPVPSWPPKPQTNRRCELMRPLPLPMPDARSLCLPAAFSQSPAESPIKTGLRRPAPPPVNGRRRALRARAHGSARSRAPHGRRRSPRAYVRRGAPSTRAPSSSRGRSDKA